MTVWYFDAHGPMEHFEQSGIAPHANSRKGFFLKAFILIMVFWIAPAWVTASGNEIAPASSNVPGWYHTLVNDGVSLYFGDDEFSQRRANAAALKDCTTHSKENKRDCVIHRSWRGAKGTCKNVGFGKKKEADEVVFFVVNSIQEHEKACSLLRSCTVPFSVCG